MMTVKVITETGEESVFAATWVNFVPARAKHCAPAEDSLWYYDRDGRSHEIKGKDAFVMNEQGNTVARYHLSSKAPYEPATP